LGKLLVDRQIILKLFWMTKGDEGVGRGLSGLDTSGMMAIVREHQAFSISILYTGEQLALCSSHITPWERAPCVDWFGHSSPGYEHGRITFWRLRCGHPVHSHLLYQATTAHMMSCTNLY
jgi:hypothetical protein